MIKLLLVDDHALVRIGIRYLLGDVPDLVVVGEARDGESALKLAPQLNPDVVLMDLTMPGIGGIEATRRLKRFYAGIKILVVTATNHPLLSSRILQAGATGYVLKTDTKEAMVCAIRAVKAGQRYLTPKITTQLAMQHLVEQKDLSPFATLTERELQIVMMVVSGMEAEAIGVALSLSPATINSYRHRMFKKLAIDSNVALTHLAIRHGLLEDPREGVT